MFEFERRAARMTLVRYQPAPPLDTWIECFWWSNRDQSVGPECMLPTGAASLIFLLGDETLSCWAPNRRNTPLLWSGSIVHGPQTQHYIAGPKPPGRTVGIALRPGAVAAVLGVPASEVVDRHVPLNRVWGGRAAALRARLREATEPQQAFAILEAELNMRLRRPLLVHPAVANSIAKLTAGRPGTRMSDMRREMNVSTRHFIGLFKTAMGMTPRQYYRIRRFSSVLRALAAEGAGNLADLAAEKGYADQPHLNKEFREFTGTTPSRYRPRNAQSPYHSALTASPAPSSGKKNPRRA